MNECTINNELITPDNIYCQIYSFNENKYDYSNWIRKAVTKEGLSIYFFKNLIAKINYSKTFKSNFLAIPDNFSGFFTSDSFIPMPPVKRWSRFLVKNSTALNTFGESFSELYSFLESDYCVDNEFGCCHLYNECSDEKKCIQPNVTFSNRCYYKKNLNDGRIFYGMNRNV